MEELDSETNLLAADGSIATATANSARASEEVVADYGYKKVQFDISFDVSSQPKAHFATIEGLYKKGETDQPLIIGTFGFIADKMAPPPFQFMRIAEHSPLHGYNILILDHPTSAPFYCANGENGGASWGGIEEGYILIEVAKQMKEQLEQEGHLAQTIHLVGNSMGGTGVIHAAYRGKGIIDSVIAFSSVTDYTDVPGNTLRHLRKDSAFGPSFASFSDYLNVIGFRILLGGFEDIITSDTRCREKGLDKIAGKDNQDKDNQYSQDGQNNLKSQVEQLYLGTPRYNNSELMKTLLEPYVRDAIFPQQKQEAVTIQEYLVMCDANAIAQKIAIPLFVVHAHDDPVVPNSHAYRFRVAAYGNKFVAVKITEDGGHWGYSAYYGPDWVGCFIKTYIDYWSKKEFRLEERCF